MALPERVPPQNIEAEQAVLGAMMIKKEAIVEAQEILQPEDFYREAHRRVYDAMLKLAENDEAVDLVTLTEQLRKDGELEKVGGIPFITTIANIVPARRRALPPVGAHAAPPHRRGDGDCQRCL